MSNHPNSSDNSSPEVTYILKTYSIGSLEGKLLTLIEASTPDPEQRKSLKDIVRQTIWGWAVQENLIDLYDWEQSVLKFREENEQKRSS